MRKLNLFFIGLCLIACSTQERDNIDNGSAAGTGDDEVAKRVSGTWLLSTDYHYQERCNYLPEEFVRNLFQLGENVELAKYSEINSCELRWGSNKVGIYLESNKPFESTFQSEYFFDKLFQPEAKKAADENAVAKPTIYGPQPQGTNAELPASTTTTSAKQDSARGNDPSAPIDGMTNPTPPIASPAKNTATGVAVENVGDKAIWEPGKRALHVLYNNHVFSVVAQIPGGDAKAKQGAIGLAKLVTHSLDDDTD
ncbi:hypothetical protein GCM10028818_07490 [Spirosoma horti]